MMYYYQTFIKTFLKYNIFVLLTNRNLERANKAELKKVNLSLKDLMEAEKNVILQR